MKDEKKEYIKNLKAEITMMMGKKQRINKNFLLEGLTRLELFALEQIHEAKSEEAESRGIRVSDLAKRMDILQSSASRVLNTLEERDLIYREIDPENRRNIRVFLTEKGERTRFKCYKNLNELLERIVEEMGAEEMDRLLASWKRLSDLLEQEVTAMEAPKE